MWKYTVAKAIGNRGQACGNVDAISSSAWAGPGSPVMVAAFRPQG